MIAGLEFLKSWRFWIVLVASTFLITLGTAGGYIVSVRYFPLLSGEPDPLYQMLAGFAVCFPVGGLVWLFYRQEKPVRRYPKERKLRLALCVAVATGIVVVIENFAVTRFLLDPVLGADANQHLSTLFAFLFGMGFGQAIASTEWAAMIGPGSDADRAVTPESP